MSKQAVAFPLLAQYYDTLEAARLQYVENIICADPRYGSATLLLLMNLPLLYLAAHAPISDWYLAGTCFWYLYLSHRLQTEFNEQAFIFTEYVEDNDSRIELLALLPEKYRAEFVDVTERADIIYCDWMHTFGEKRNVMGVWYVLEGDSRVFCNFTEGDV